MQVYIPYKLAYVLIIFELNMIVSSYIHACKYSLHIIIIFFKILCLQFLFKRLSFYKLRYFYENFVDFKNEISDQSQAGGIDPTMQNGRSTLVLSLLNPSLSSAYTHIYTCLYVLHCAVLQLLFLSFSLCPLIFSLFISRREKTPFHISFSSSFFIR